MFTKILQYFEKIGVGFPGYDDSPSGNDTSTDYILVSWSSNMGDLLNMPLTAVSFPKNYSIALQIS